MSVWYSAAGRNTRQEDGTPIVRVGDIYINVITDASGMFTIELTNLGVEVEEVLDFKGWVLNQTLTAATDVANILHVMIVEVTETAVKGVVVLGNSVTVALGQLIKPVKRAGSGVEAKVKLTVKRGA